jgi:uncharacterized protein YeaO (DUF488 family)
VISVRVPIEMIKLKRVYEKKSKEDGYRILVDRLWPRGLKKEQAGVNLWLKDIAPSSELRNWFSHDPSKWAEFKRRYQSEVLAKKELIEQLKSLEREKHTITLLFATKDMQHNNAIVLQKTLQES